MSDLQNAIRQFGDVVKEAEERTANSLGEIKAGIRATGNDTRRKLRTQLAKAEKGLAAVAAAFGEIKIILEDDETAENHIMAEIEGIRQIALAPPQIEQKDETNG